MTGDRAKELIAEFDTASKLRTDIAKPAWHNSLRLPHGDKLTNEKWKSLADDYMYRMGFSDTHLRCYVLHDDHVGQHIHIIANRIDAVSAKVNLGRHESLRSGRIIQELEIKYGLTITKGPEPLKPTDTGKETKKAKKISRNEEMYEERTGEICNKKQLQSILDKSLEDTPNIKTFLLKLEEQKVKWKANLSSTGKMNGLSFELNGISFKASQLGKSYSWNNLQKKLNYHPERDNNLFIKNESIPACETKTVFEEKAEKQFVPKDIQTIAEKISALEAEIRKNRFPPVAEESDNRQSNNRQSKTQNWLPFVKHIALLFKNYGSSLLHSHFRFHQILAVIPLMKPPKIVKKLKH